MVPAQGIVSERRDRCIPPVCGGPDTCSWLRGTLLYESRALQRANPRQGKETVHLVGNRMNWWDDRAGGHRLWLWGWTWLLSLSATHPNRGNDNGCLDR